jgi:hypothetical protein
LRSAGRAPPLLVSALDGDVCAASHSGRFIASSCTRLGVSQRRTEIYEEVRNFLPLSDIELPSLGHPARSLVATPTELSRNPISTHCRSEARGAAPPFPQASVLH